LGGGGGVPIRTRRQTLWHSRYEDICNLHLPVRDYEFGEFGSGRLEQREYAMREEGRGQNRKIDREVERQKDARRREGRGE
jgi:hypothetical protein